MSYIRASLLNNSTSLALKLNGELNHLTVINFLKSVPSINKSKLLILDCLNLTELDGSGILALSVIISHCESVKCKCYLDNLSGQPKQLVNYLGLNSYVLKHNKFSLIDKWIKYPLGVFR
jgi:anti-anti-sigma regulatory factor